MERDVGRPAARHQTERGAFCICTPPRGLVGAVQMWEGMCLLLWEAWSGWLVSECT